MVCVLTQAVLQLVLRERRVLCATLHVDVSNAAALGLYMKAGFEEVGLLLTAGSGCSLRVHHLGLCSTLGTL